MNIGPKIGEGHTAEIFLRDNRLAVKLFRPGIPVQLAEAEWLAAQHVTRLGLPAPAARAREEWQGRPAIVYDYVTGIPLQKAVLEHQIRSAPLLTDSQKRRCLRGFRICRTARSPATGICIPTTFC